MSNELKELDVSLYLDNIGKSQEKIEEIDSLFQGYNKTYRMKTINWKKRNRRTLKRQIGWTS